MSLSIAFANIYEGNRHIDAVGAVLCSLQADVIGLTEVTDVHLNALCASTLVDSHPHVIARPARGNGVALFSCRPLSDSDVLVDHAGAALRATIDGPLPITLAVAQLPTFIAVGASTWRNAHEALGRWLDGGMPTVLVGDFNAVAWQQPQRALRSRGFYDAHRHVGRPCFGSWPRWFPLVRLDHALLRGDVVARRVRNIAIPGSDHRGFILDVSILGREMAAAAAHKTDVRP